MTTVCTDVIPELLNTSRAGCDVAIPYASKPSAGKLLQVEPTFSEASLLVRHTASVYPDCNV